jgi:hypothetical protein
MGAVAWGLWPSPRFPSPLIKPDGPISGIRLSGWLHREARDGGSDASIKAIWQPMSQSGTHSIVTSAALGIEVIHPFRDMTKALSLARRSLHRLTSATFPQCLKLF